METFIRLAVEKDISGIIHLLEQVLLVHHKGRPDLFKEHGWKYTESELQIILANKDNPVFVCTDKEGRIIGHCFCQTINHPEGPATYAYKTLYIDDLCVDENVRGQHVGKALYEYAKQYAAVNGYYNLTLHAWARNTGAVGFYTHLGMSIQQYTMEEVLNGKKARP